MQKVTIFISGFVIMLLASTTILAQSCLFITVADTIKSTEEGIAQMIESWGYQVTPDSVGSLVDYTADDYANYTFAFASESINSTKLAPFKLIPIPLVTTEAWASKPAALAWCDAPTAANIAPEPVLIVDNTNHPLAAGHAEDDLIDLVTDPAGFIIPTIPSIDVITIGVLESDPTKSIIYGIEKGTETTDGYITENRAVCIGIHEYGYASMTEAAFEFIHAAINWVTEDSSGVAEKIKETPTAFRLAQNYPNPFNPATEIEFSISEKAYTNLTVYNALGQIMETLVNGELNAGKYHVVFNAVNMPAGVYFYQIRSGSGSEVRKMLLLK